MASSLKLSVRVDHRSIKDEIIFKNMTRLSLCSSRSLDESAYELLKERVIQFTSESGFLIKGTVTNDNKQYGIIQFCWCNWWYKRNPYKSLFWISGAAFTRFQTLHLKQRFPQALADNLISYGSCQFPTLGFVVERYKAISDFIPEPFWRVKGISNFLVS